jgi:hypothetical protein
VGLALGRRGRVEERAERGARERRVGREREVGAVGHRRGDDERRAAAERSRDDRLEPGQRRGRRRHAVRQHAHARRPAAVAAQQALEVRLVDANAEVRRAPALERAGREREQHPRRDHDDGHGPGDQVQPARGVLALRRPDRGDLGGGRDRNAGRPCAGRIQERDEAVHVLRVEERALPGRAVLERDPAQVQARQHAGREQRGGEMQDAGGAQLVQRRRASRPVVGERGHDGAHAAVAARARDAGADARDPGAQAARRRRLAVAHDVADRDHEVDGDVPGQKAEHGRREDVDALRAVDLVEAEADQEREHDDRRADPRAPREARDRRGQRALARSDALDGERGATREERIGRRARADDLGGRAARPGAIGVAPCRPRGVGGLDGPHRDDLHGGGFVHAWAILRAGMIAGAGNP